MEWIYGITDFCWLGRQCRIDWNAWAAIGTIGAVWIAIALAVRDLLWRQKDRRGRATWIAFQLYAPVRYWSIFMRRLAHDLPLETHALAVLEAIDGEPGEGMQPLEIPDDVAKHMDALHELGEAAEPLARAMFLAQQAYLSRHSFLSAYRGDDMERGDELIATFTGWVSDAAAALEEAVHVLHAPFERARPSRMRALIRRSDVRT